MLPQQPQSLVQFTFTPIQFGLASIEPKGPLAEAGDQVAGVIGEQVFGASGRFG